MAAAKKSTKKSAAKKSTAKKSTKKSAAKKSTAKKSTAKKGTRKSTAKKSTKKAAKKSTRKSTASRSSGTQQLVVASRIKEAAKAQDVRVAGDFAEAFNEEVNEMLTKAIERTKSNGRGTVRPGDL